MLARFLCTGSHSGSLWPPAEFFKPVPLRHTAGSRSELFAQPLCWNQGLAWHREDVQVLKKNSYVPIPSMYGINIPTKMVDFYGQCR